MVIEQAEPGRRQLHDAEVFVGLVVDVDVEAHLVGVERLGTVDVRDRNHHELELEVHGIASWVVGRGDRSLAVKRRSS